MAAVIKLPVFIEIDDCGENAISGAAKTVFVHTIKCAGLVEGKMTFIIKQTQKQAKTLQSRKRSERYLQRFDMGHLG